MAGEGSGANDGKGESDGLPKAGADVPPIDFTTFVLSLSTSALAHLSDAEQASGSGAEQLGLARQTIDLLALLEEKTSGNLDGEEERLLTQVVADLKLRYVTTAKAKS